MYQATETRELITLGGVGVLVQGTYHRPRRQNGGAATGLSELNRTGVLFLNSLSVPRSSTGDSAVYWADSFAACGYPSFRLDLPGLGDSDGAIPGELLDFINAGGYKSIAAAKVRELCRRFGLSGVVIVGHCAGAITALYAAGECHECKGLILMDPYFHLAKAVRPKVRLALSDWARRSRVGGFLSDVYDLVMKCRLHLFGGSLPANANVALIGRWKQVASAGMPILLLKAPGLKSSGAKPRAGNFDYLTHVLKLAGHRSDVVVRFIEGADHSFANRSGRALVRKHAESWLTAHFSAGVPEGGAMNSSSPEEGDGVNGRHRCMTV